MKYKRMIYQDVKNFVESNSDSKLLSDVYINVKSKLNFLCICDNEFSTTFDKFKYQNKRQCIKCSWLKSDDEIQVDVDYLTSKYEISLVNKYIDKSTTFYAKNKDDFYIKTSYRRLEDGSNPEVFHCNNKYTIENIKRWLLLNNKTIILLSNVYVNAHDSLKWECEKGHVFNSSWNNIVKIIDCPICSKRYPKEDNNLLVSNPKLCEEWDYKKNDKPPSEYTPFSNKLVWWECENGHSWQAAPNHRQRGFGCRKCYEMNNTGENNPAWKGGVTPLSAKLRNSDIYKEWRRSVFIHDKYTCQCCGDNRGGNLHAHHIQNFSENEGLRYDISNGITLCNSCHNPSVYGSFHNTYGTKNNTREQLEEYIEWYKDDVEKILKEIS